MSQEQENISDINFINITIGTYKCNVNRSQDDLYLLTGFDDTIPRYSIEDGPYIELMNRKENTSKIMRLSDSACRTSLIKGGSKMTSDEYFPLFVEKKKEYVQNYLVKNTFAAGFEIPATVQSLVVPELIQRRDSLIQFKSGAGKTLAFLFGCLWGFDPTDDKLQYIFITSSHEVAAQIYDRAISILPSSARVAMCVGQKKNINGVNSNFKESNIIGTSSLNNRPKTMKEEREQIRQAQVIVCTMGRLYDFMCNRNWIPSTKYLKAICVDEFDNIVTSRSKSKNSSIMSTEQQMAEIIHYIESEAPNDTQNDTQRVFFSATVSSESIQTAHSYFRKNHGHIGNPFIVLLDAEDNTLEGIKQYYVPCQNYAQKKDILMDLLKQCRISQCIIFVNRIETANDLKIYLDDQYISTNSAVFHGLLSADVRKNIHEDFINNKIRLLISTDLTSRGLDVQGINLVINFDMPEYLENYIHRIGRSGRYGRKGVSISFVIINNNNNEMEKVKRINECSNQSKMLPLPRDLANLL
ncbi:translation initiation factor 4a [Megavirus baoshan]|uniref:Putative translation initiation factor 4a n=1 Tax=Megavirus baoshan TaxID=2496520 RepID=A0A3S8UX74_9VIRU|nr:translation initiation factor 4a [Megavirus baoshan]AZL89424.1 translation initiation factor 4a [Megavirus baoshan]